MNSSMDNNLNNSYGSHHPEPLPFMPNTTYSSYDPVITPSPGPPTQSRYFCNDKKTPEPIKANLPPPPPKTPFMCFSESKDDGNNNSLKSVAEEWRNLTSAEKEHWEEQARKDRTRYLNAKAKFIPTPDSLPKRRAKKHPLAPKRPMSAFLKFSSNRRKKVKACHPDMNNTDISRLLGEMWRNLNEDEKKPYVEEELRERQKYKEDIKHWRLIQKKKEMDEALNKAKAKSTGEISPINRDFQESPQRLSHHSMDFAVKDHDNQSMSSWSQLNRAMKFDEDEYQVGELNTKLRFSPADDYRHPYSNHQHNQGQGNHNPPYFSRNEVQNQSPLRADDRDRYEPHYYSQHEVGSHHRGYEYMSHQRSSEQYRDNFNNEYYDFPHRYNSNGQPEANYHSERQVPPSSQNHNQRHNQYKEDPNRNHYI